MRVRRLARNLLPFSVSAGVLAYLLSDLQIGLVLEKTTWRGISILLVTLLAFGFSSLWIEGLSLLRLTRERAQRPLDLWTAMRIKSASYLLAIVNVALGAGALTFLLRRRSGMGVSDAAGVVILIFAIDLCLLVVAGALGATAIATDAITIRGAALFASLGVIAGGFALLRTPVSLGPLDRLRELEFFRAARTTAPRLLAELAALRSLLVLGFMFVFWAALAAFEIEVPMGPLLLGILAVVLVSSLPIAISGLGTGQAAFIFCFGSWADEHTLLASSLALSIGLILLRGLMGLTFAGEFTRDALAATRSSES
jgi:hypothetical protein